MSPKIACLREGMAQAVCQRMTTCAVDKLFSSTYTSVPHWANSATLASIPSPRADCAYEMISSDDKFFRCEHLQVFAERLPRRSCAHDPSGPGNIHVDEQGIIYVLCTYATLVRCRATAYFLDALTSGHTRFSSKWLTLAAGVTASTIPLICE